MNKKRLFLLAVGVNQYLGAGIDHLNGCENDAKAFYDFIQETVRNTDFEWMESNQLLLTSQPPLATKSNIIHHFQHHFTKAQSGDVVVFFFAGHGAEEEADEVFHVGSALKTLNTLVCHDSRTGSITDLADKELRYLIHQITGNQEHPPHFVLITDSCHSGSVTRDGDFIPRLTEKTEQRKWEQFIFSNFISKEKIREEGLANVLPQGQHIHLAACENTELANEVNGKGVFTSTLIDVLKRSSGKISYEELFSRVKDFVEMSAMKAKQTPVINAIEGSTNDLEQLFLGGASTSKGLKAKMRFNTRFKKWQIKLGALHGMPTTNVKDVEILILDDIHQTITTATVQEVTANKTFVFIENEDNIDEYASYDIEIKGIYQEPIYFYLDKTNGKRQMQELEDFILVVEKEELIREHNYTFTEYKAQAHYITSYQDGYYEISRSGDILQRPIVLQQEQYEKDTVQEYLGKIANYHFVVGIKNPNTTLQAKSGSAFPVDIQLYKMVGENDTGEGELIIPNKKNEIIIHKDDWITIKTNNNTRRKKLYFALFQLDDLFGIKEDMLGKSPQEVPQEKSLWYNEKKPIQFDLKPYITDFEFNDARFILKLLGSEETFEIQKIKQKPIPPPQKNIGEPETVYRSLRKRHQSNVKKWADFTMKIIVKN